MNVHTLLLGTLALSSSVLAQTPTLISPAASAAMVGNGPLFFNLSAFNGAVYQQIHDVSSFHIRSPLVVTELRLRMATPNAPGFTIDVEIFMALSPHPAANASTTFANNVVQGSEINVFSRKLVRLPTVPDNSWAVAPFVLDQAFPTQ